MGNENQNQRWSNQRLVILSFVLNQLIFGLQLTYFSLSLREILLLVKGENHSLWKLIGYSFIQGLSFEVLIYPLIVIEKKIHGILFILSSYTTSILDLITHIMRNMQIEKGKSNNQSFIFKIVKDEDVKNEEKESE